MRTMKIMSRLAIGLIMAIGLAGAAMAQTLPGEGQSVRMARATWDTGWFQAEIYKQMLERLGYQVGTIRTLDNPPFYQAVGQGDLDLWVNGWFPLHNTYEEAFAAGATTVGYVARGGALQGYLVDKASAERFGITNIMDFTKPEIKAAFDATGDGKADMVACPPGWGCEEQISRHIEELQLGEHINLIKAGYSAAMADALGRYQQGEPILFYTWTPNWTVGVLQPGEDVVWIQMPDATPETTVAGVQGCVADPCELGWEANDIRPVANTAFLEANPAVKALLETASIPLDDIFAQNAKMNAGESSEAEIARHAAEWLEANADMVDGWIEEAKAAATN
jgi:glycine betaine/proline transport system substrate-binding protein